jgi:hypothetical protein
MMADASWPDSDKTAASRATAEASLSDLSSSLYPPTILSGGSPSVWRVLLQKGKDRMCGPAPLAVSQRRGSLQTAPGTVTGSGSPLVTLVKLFRARFHASARPSQS